MLISFIVFLPLLKRARIAQGIVLIFISYFKCNAEPLFEFLKLILMGVTQLVKNQKEHITSQTQLRGALQMF